MLNCHQISAVPALSTTTLATRDQDNISVNSSDVNAMVSGADADGTDRRIPDDSRPEVSTVSLGSFISR